MSSPLARAGAPAGKPRRRFAFSRTHDLVFLLFVELGGIDVFVPGYLDPASLLDTSRTFVETGLLAWA